MKNRKVALSIFVALIMGLFVVELVSSITLPSGAFNACLRKGETIYFSECNEAMDDYICEKDSCTNICIENKGGYFCPAPGCNNACIYIYSADQNSIIAPISPESDAKLPPGDVKFTFQLSLPTSLERCDLYVNDVRKRYTTTPKATNEFTVRSMDEGTYSWRIECKEKANYGGDTLISSSRMLYLEEGAQDNNDTATIGLMSPENSASFTGAQQISFKFNASGAVLSASECTLYLDDAAASSINTIAAENQISYNVPVGQHAWKVSCSNGNYVSETRSLTINAQSAPPSDTGGGGGSGGGGGPRIYIASKTIESEAGYTQSIKKDEKISFTLVVPVNNTNTTKNEAHTITAKEINNGSAKIRIQSDPIDAELLTGEEKKFDLTNDGVYDLSVMLNSADKLKANITTKLISEKVVAEEEEEETGAETEKTITEEEQKTTDGITGASVGIIDRIKSNSTVIIIVAVIAVIIIVALASSSKKGKEGKKE